MVPFVVPILESRGFTTINTNNDDAMVCRGDCGGAYGMHANVSLWYHGKLVASGRATNPGLGTWLAHGAVVQDLSDNAAAALADEVEKMAAKPNGSPVQTRPARPRRLDSPAGAPSP